MTFHTKPSHTHQIHLHSSTHTQSQSQTHTCTHARTHTLSLWLSLNLSQIKWEMEMRTMLYLVWIGEPIDSGGWFFDASHKWTTPTIGNHLWFYFVESAAYLLLNCGLKKLAASNITSDLFQSSLAINWIPIRENWARAFDSVLAPNDTHYTPATMW